MPTGVVTDWGQAIMTAIAGAVALFLGAIPKIIGALLILLVGWLISRVLGGLVASVLRGTGFDHLAERTGLSRFFDELGFTTDASGVMGKLVYWFFFLITLAVAVEALDIPAVNAVINAFLLWLPSLAVAVIVLLIAQLIAGPLAAIVRATMAEAGVANPRLFSDLTKVAIWLFAIVIAANAVQIGATLVNAIFIGFVAALTLAVGLAFGLGGRDTAALLVRRWYGQAEQSTPSRAPVEPTRPETEPPEEPRRVA